MSCMGTCYDFGWSVGETFITTDVNNGINPNVRVKLINDDRSDQPQYSLMTRCGSNNVGEEVWLYNSGLVKYKGVIECCSFNNAKERDAYWDYLRTFGYSEKLYACKGNIGIIYRDTMQFMSVKTKVELDSLTLDDGYMKVFVKPVVPAPVPVVPVPVVQVQAPAPVDNIVVTAIVENKIENEIITKDDPMTTSKVKLEKTKQLQIDAAKIAAKIEIGKVANTQITKRIMKQIDLPPFLIGYKKQIEPVIRLLVANGALIAADSMGVNNKKAEFIMEAMQLAGTQEVLGLINLDETIDTLIGMIDPKLMVRAGVEDIEDEVKE